MQNFFLSFQQRRNEKKLNRESFKKMQKKKKKKKERNSLATTRFLQIFERNSKFEKIFLNFDTLFYFDVVCKTLYYFDQNAIFENYFFAFAYIHEF